MAYIGDDWVDAAPMSLVGLPMAVANARPEIQRMAAWTSSAYGGQGAVREALEFILTAQGKLDAMWRTWSET
jgi:3-deoxy-D-manno-octulosonate 8-phosphate phosphatase (KDO 8-P phosphatase)